MVFVPDLLYRVDIRCPKDKDKLRSGSGSGQQTQASLAEKGMWAWSTGGIGSGAVFQGTHLYMQETHPMAFQGRNCQNLPRMSEW